MVCICIYSLQNILLHVSHNGKALCNLKVLVQRNYCQPFQWAISLWTQPQFHIPFSLISRKDQILSEHTFERFLVEYLKFLLICFWTCSMLNHEDKVYRIHSCPRKSLRRKASKCDIFYFPLKCWLWKERFEKERNFENQIFTSQYY